MGRVGNRVGFLVGLYDGNLVEGYGLGTLVGNAVGYDDGFFVGKWVGYFVGRRVGGGAGLQQYHCHFGDDHDPHHFGSFSAVCL